MLNSTPLRTGSRFFVAQAAKSAAVMLDRKPRRLKGFIAKSLARLMAFAHPVSEDPGKIHNFSVVDLAGSRSR